MTALQIAKEHCANWLHDGKGCLGAIIDDDLQIRRCCPKPKCALGTRGERCRYFEECVAPMGPGIENPRLREDFAGAIRTYRRTAKLPCAAERPCPVCGRPMEPRERFCFACSAARRKESWRLTAERARTKSRQLSEKQPLAINGLQG
jgi:hypothetical protein